MVTARRARGVKTLRCIEVARLARSVFENILQFQLRVRTTEVTPSGDGYTTTKGGRRMLGFKVIAELPLAPYLVSEFGLTILDRDLAYVRIISTMITWGRDYVSTRLLLRSILGYLVRNSHDLNSLRAVQLF